MLVLMLEAEVSAGHSQVSSCKTLGQRQFCLYIHSSANSVPLLVKNYIFFLNLSRGALDLIQDLETDLVIVSEVFL